jgi:hypothetical protein
MKHYMKPTIEITRLDSGESIMKVSSVNINKNNIIHDSTGISVGQLGSWS